MHEECCSGYRETFCTWRIIGYGICMVLFVSGVVIILSIVGFITMSVLTYLVMT